MSILQIVALLKTLGPHAIAIIKFAIEHKAEFQALLAALRELFAGNAAFAAAGPDDATAADVAAACGCSDAEAAAFVEACG